jgi:DnaJ-class molecular chaperone
MTEPVKTEPVACPWCSGKGHSPEGEKCGMCAGFGTVSAELAAYYQSPKGVKP